MGKKFNQEKYGELLMTVLPQVIENDEELEGTEKIIDALLDKGENLTLEEEKLLDLLSDIVQKYEDEHHSIPDVSPKEVLQFLIDENNLKQKDLIHIFSSSGIASEVINGKRSISKTQAKKLAEHFKVSIELFI